MSIIKDIPDLLDANVISPETADRIRGYYSERKKKSSNRIFIAFGVLGATLVGLGIILLVAHNWDEFNRPGKTFFAFLPLIIGQGFCLYTLINRKESTAWRESTSAFLFFAVGSAISLVGQIYNIHGDLSRFLLTWTLLCFPLIFIMNSSVASLLYLIGITYYGCETGFGSYPQSRVYLYWALLAAVLLHYYLLIRKKPGSNFMIFYHWMVPVSLVIILGTFLSDSANKDTHTFMWIAYVSLFGLFYMVGKTDFFMNRSPGSNAYRILGSLGITLLLLILSFNDVWIHIWNPDFSFNEMIIAPAFIAAAVISLISASLFFILHSKKKFFSMNPFEPVFLIFIVIFIYGTITLAAYILINILVLVLGIFTIRKGAIENHMGIFNYGLLMITALVGCRFFDTDLSFLTRGILFIVIGILFFLANYLMLKKRNANE